MRKRRPYKFEPGLTLARYDGEQIDITLPDGRLITITVLESRPGRARLHFSAARDIPVVRRELRKETTAA